MLPTLAASQTLRCQIDTGEQTQTISLSPTADVYDMRSLDFQNGFRFSAVWLGPQKQLKTYVYFSYPKKRALISQQVLNLPPSQCPLPLAQQTVYAGTLERELHMACHLPCE
jgi:hypothetical protein